MYLKKNVDIGSFLAQVDKCEGEVLFHTAKDDMLNLKTTLSQYVFTSMCSDHAVRQSSEVMIQKESDRELLKRYLTPDPEA